MFTLFCKCVLITSFHGINNHFFFSLAFQEIDVKAGGGKTMTIGTMCRSMLEKLEWFDTRFPRIPIHVQVSNVNIS